MSGHSKWNNIKHRKGAADARKSKLFSKLAKYIMVAARNGGGNLAENLRLRYAVDRARAESMPKDSIERAIKKGMGAIQGAELTELTYEGIGPGGVSLIIEVLTDNRNRTSGEMRHVLEKRGGSLGKSNSVAWKFERRGVLALARDEVEEEELFDVAIDAGADDIEQDGDNFEIYTSPDDLDKVRRSLQQFIEKKRGAGEKKWGEAEDARPIFTRNELRYVPQSTIAVSDVQQARQILLLLEKIEDHDDVQNVYCDFDIPDDIMEEITCDS
ncbi:MAG: YebC/PmpR family DNA-binding transcriptional regulator [Planctomycetota bacterium]|nr:YebC/PmpR family DNA-binding transcriptional regulator [Planctomycetota bacterium]